MKTAQTLDVALNTSEVPLNPSFATRIWHWVRAAPRRRKPPLLHRYGFSDHLLRDLGILDGDRSDGGISHRDD
jgi:hypothetical protein